ncbi:MAG: polyphosphate kinase 1 [Porphyromonas sp.]|nr:polyphosphate kinase 1 [Porphyromonas sp.]
MDAILHTSRYFKRDLSWLSFNKRVLLEAEDTDLPIYERLKFLGIFCSNLQEFYQVRVANARAAIENRKQSDFTQEEAMDTFAQIMEEVSSQEDLFYDILYNRVIPDLGAQGVDLITDINILTEAEREYLYQYCIMEVYPHLSPIFLDPDHANPFVRDNRLYLAINAIKNDKEGGKAEDHYIIKLPFDKANRFVPIPPEIRRAKKGKTSPYAYVFLEDVIRSGIHYLLPNYERIDAYAYRISRDVDVIITENIHGKDLAQRVKSILSQRERGAVSRCLYDRRMPQSLLERIMKLSYVKKDLLIPSDTYIMLSDLLQLPNPIGPELARCYPTPIPWHPEIPRDESMIRYIVEHNLTTALSTPYQSFKNFIQLLHSAATSPDVEEIKLTQYRVAEESEVIEKMTLAALNGKKVTVFVELKARFDEANNLITSEVLQRAGVKVVYSLPKLKVHAKTCLIRLKSESDTIKGLACFSTGNFNEDTASIYSDLTYITPDTELVKDLVSLFKYVESEVKILPTFRHLLVPGCGLVETLNALINKEIEEAKAGRKAHIILKLNALQDQAMIEKLYEASCAGVEIDLAVRGICCAIPNQSFSKNIRVTRTIDMYLEHTRLWYFYHGGKERIYIASADWMKRNLYKRIEYAAPILHPNIKALAKDILMLQIKANKNTYDVDEHLENRSRLKPSCKEVRIQEELYKVIRHHTKQKS